MRRAAKKIHPMSLAAYRTADDPDVKRRQALWILEAFATEPQRYNAVNVHTYWEAIYLTSKQRLDRAREKEATDATMKYFGKKGESGRRLIQRYKKQVEDRLRGPMLPALIQHARDIEIYSRIYFTVNEAARLLEKTENIKVDCTQGTTETNPPGRVVGKPFAKGTSGNPSGRPRIEPRVRRYARRYDRRMCRVLAELAQDPKAPASERRRAAMDLIAVGSGRPALVQEIAGRAGEPLGPLVNVNVGLQPGGNLSPEQIYRLMIENVIPPDPAAFRPVIEAQPALPKPLEQQQ